MAYSPVERFEIARVLLRMTGVLRRNLGTFAGLALLLSGVPNLLVEGAAFGIPTNAGIGNLALLQGAGLGGGLVNLLMSALLQAALIHGTINDLNGQRVRFSECLTTAIRHVIPLVLISVATTVACFVGLLLFIVPGVILSLLLCVAAPVRVVEGLGVFNSMGRSGDLTRHHRGAILLTFLLYGLAWLMVTALMTQFSGLIALNEFRGIEAWGLALFNTLVQSAAALIGAAGIASIYFELRTVKEGVGVEALAAAFN